MKIMTMLTAAGTASATHMMLHPAPYYVFQMRAAARAGGQAGRRCPAPLVRGAERLYVTCSDMHAGNLVMLPIRQRHPQQAGGWAATHAGFSRQTSRLLLAACGALACLLLDDDGAEWRCCKES